MAEEYYRKLIDLVGKEFNGCDRRLIGSEEFFRSAVLVPFMEADGVDSILFEKRAAGIRQGGEICFPGGMVDDEDSTSIETVIRETIEETGADADDVSVFDSAGYLLTRNGSLIDVYLGWMDISSIADFRPNPDEVEKLFAVPVKFFLDTEPEFYNYRQTCEPWYSDEKGQRVDLFPAKELGLPETYWNPWSNDRNRFVVYRFEGEVIWGITARIMNTVSKLLRRVG